MPVKPVFIVTSVKEKRTPASPNKFTGRGTTEPMWCVTMKSGFFAGAGVTFRYPDKNKADAFSPWQIYDPSQIIREAAPLKESFVVQDIYKSKGYGAKNLYTDRRSTLENWTVSMVSPEDTWVDLWYPTEAEAFKYPMGRAFTIQDLFGTLRAAPFPMSGVLEAAIQAARERYQEHQAILSQTTTVSTRPPEWPAQPVGQSHTAAEIGAANHAAALAEAAASSQNATAAGADAATAAAAAQAVLSQQTSTLLIGQPSDQQIFFWITNGGAAGWYFVGTAQELGTALYGPGTYNYGPNLAAVGAPVGPGGSPYLHYTAGTFDMPYNGLLIGEFVSDASVSAGTIQPYH